MLLNSSLRNFIADINRGIANTFGAYQTFYEANLLKNESPSNISWIGSIQAFLLLIVGGVVTGPIFDAGYLRALVFVGSILVVFGMMMTSLCTEYWQIVLAQGIVVGAGAGCMMLPAVAIIPQYFTTKRAFATGVAASGSSIGKCLNYEEGISLKLFQGVSFTL